MGGGLGNQVKKVKEFRSTSQQLQRSHSDVKHSTGDTASNTVMTPHGARWVLELLGGTFHKWHKCLRPLCYTPEINIK